jgi:hypothetical protein
MYRFNKGLGKRLRDAGENKLPQLSQTSVFMVGLSLCQAQVNRTVTQNLSSPLYHSLRQAARKRL